jgi:hypothetical protein
MPIGFEQEDGLVILDTSKEFIDETNIEQRTGSYPEQTAVLILCQYEGDNLNFASVLENRSSQDFIMHGVLRDERTLSFMQDIENTAIGPSIAPLEGNIPDAQPGVWYYALVAVDSAGNALGAVWEKDNPAQRTALARSPGLDFVADKWAYRLMLWDGVFYWDAFYEVTFDEIIID